MLSLIHFYNIGALLTTSRHERIHTRRPYHVDRADKYSLDDDLVNLEVLNEVLCCLGSSFWQLYLRFSPISAFQASLWRTKIFPSCNLLSHQGKGILTWLNCCPHFINLYSGIKVVAVNTIMWKKIRNAASFIFVSFLKCKV